MSVPADPTTATARVLVVDDDSVIRASLAGLLEGEGCDVTRACSAAEALLLLDACDYELIISDVAMPEQGGFELLRRVRRDHSDTAVILLTGYGTIADAVRALRLGASDYLTKPMIPADVRSAVRRALRDRMTENRCVAGDQNGVERIVTHDYRMARVFELIEAVSRANTTVLITGESGTGKSLVARAIHARSPRCDKPFVEVSCGALTETLLESELFGHVRGAFTGASQDQAGKLAAGDGGTVFLDEIATASPRLQVRLLRALQERRFEPVGSNQPVEIDVRVILATNCDLRAEVEAGRFREDLYYRVNVVNIQLPPLRERRGDIPLLAKHFLAKYARATGRAVRAIEDRALECMQEYDWPGNVRELENCMERAVVLCDGEWVQVGDLPPSICEAPTSSPSAAVIESGQTLSELLEDFERRIIVAALETHDGSRQATARKLGIDRTTLYKKMKRYGIDSPS